MKTIHTTLSEQRFLHRLENMCKVHTKFDKGYRDKDVFVVKRTGHKFWIGRHLALIGRTDGYLEELISASYQVNTDGKIDVTYRFRISLEARILIFFLSLPAPIFVYLIYDALLNDYVQWGGIIITGLLTTLAVFFLSL